MSESQSPGCGHSSAAREGLKSDRERFDAESERVREPERVSVCVCEREGLTELGEDVRRRDVVDAPGQCLREGPLCLYQCLGVERHPPVLGEAAQHAAFGV